MTADVLHFRLAQTQRLSRFGVSASVDMHCHCLPGIDDGPATLADALAVCRALVEDGITHVVATPHQLGPYEEVDAVRVRQATNTLQAELVAAAVPLTVRPGAEVRADERLVGLLDAGRLLTLADGHAYLLVELPHSTMLDLRALIETLVARGVTPIISHPERHAALTRSPPLLLPWLARGALLQVTAASLTGAFGPGTQRAAWQMVDDGWVSLVASDAHDVTGRAPSMTLAVDAIVARCGHAVARRLCVQNPQAVFDGRPIVKPRINTRTAGGRR
ncbi:MAG TPA: CpsB/CapC family capsule biosynthesis tyrosine phosphatase [Tepidisphaeraceae bacterium]|jgi:protein-tyrosine phosphatase